MLNHIPRVIPILMTLTACGLPPLEPVERGDVYTLTIGDDTIASLPAAGPTVDPAEAELGWLLFWDPVLSGDRDVACATCHLPEFGYGDGLRASIGVGGSLRGARRTGGSAGHVPRNAPTVINAVFNGIGPDGLYDPLGGPMFWDNRASGLVEQAMGPVRSAVEMRGRAIPEAQIWAEVVERVNAIPEYEARFEAVYGARATDVTIARAIATFESTIVATNSRFDQWMRGDTMALTTQEKSGLVAFFDAGCAQCHNGPMFSDYELHVLAAPDGPWVTSPDTGDGEFAFRTPSLRQLEFTAPYFHGGHVDTLEDAVAFYDNFEDGGEAGDTELNPAVDPALLAEELQEVDEDQVEDIAAFLRTLSDPAFFQEEPPTVPSGLPVGGFPTAQVP